jgi:DNA-binding XRE family transcriptional regulator
MRSAFSACSRLFARLAFPALSAYVLVTESDRGSPPTEEEKMPTETPMKTYVSPNGRDWIPRDSFANRLKLVRWEARVSVEWLGAMTGLAPSTISSWERGTQPDNVHDVCRRIADVLLCSYEWLLYGSAALENLGGGKVFFPDLRHDRTGPGRSARSGRGPSAESPPIRMY